MIIIIITDELIICSSTTFYQFLIINRFNLAKIKIFQFYLLYFALRP